MVYEQITFFIKKCFFAIFVFDLKIDFLIKKRTKTWKNLGGGWGGGGNFTEDSYGLC